MASSLHEAASSVATMSDGDAVETSSTCSMEETCAKIENALRRNLKLRDMDNDSKEDEAPPIITGSLLERLLAFLGRNRRLLILSFPAFHSFFVQKFDF